MEGNNQTSFDVIIIGAGIAGITAAYRLQEQSPDQTYVILESREELGGTWSLFRYPGIRSDSDMYTFGFAFNPWRQDRTMADGASIVAYMRDTATKFGIDKKIRYQHKLLTANWSSDEHNWVMAVESSGAKKHFRARFVVFATGYYDYNEALPATIPGIKNFQGTVVHPQFWPEDLDYQDKNVVIVGSGATAVTLLPNLAKKAAKVTMLQRSPSYVLAAPQQDNLSYWPRKILPDMWARQLLRWQFMVLPYLFYKFCMTFPTAARNMLKKAAAKQLPEGYPMEPNFQPRYTPWQQRLCVSPNGDFYECLRDGKADVVTAHIKEVTEKTIILEDSDQILHPDIIVTATGLKIMIAGGAKITVDNEPIKISQKHLWKGAMLQDVPNAAVVIGYANASWTLGADATAQFVTRLLNHMKSEGYSQAVPRLDSKTGMQDKSPLQLNSTYVLKAEGDLPKAGNMAPWLPRSYYLWDLWEAKFGSLSKDMHFSRVST